MSKDVLNDRRKALEEEFFAKESKKLREQLHHQEEAQARRQALAEVAGISDDKVLDALLAADISPDTLAALSLVPLIEVAWADGNVDSKERDAVLAGAREFAGLSPGSPAHQLLERWLEHEPGPRLRTLWSEYAQTLVHNMDDASRTRFREQLMGRARRVAEAAGGVLGVKRISSVEQATLDELERALS